MYRFLVKQAYYTALTIVACLAPLGVVAQVNFEMPSVVIRSGEASAIRIPSQTISSALSSVPVQSLTIDINLKPAFLYPVRKSGDTFWGIAASGLYKKESLNGTWTRVSVGDTPSRQYRFEKSEQGELQLKTPDSFYIISGNQVLARNQNELPESANVAVKPAKKPGKKKLAVIKRQIREAESQGLVLATPEKEIVNVEVTRTATVVETKAGWVFEYTNSRKGLILKTAFRTESGSEPAKSIGATDESNAFAGFLPVKVKETAKASNKHEKGNWSEYSEVNIAEEVVFTGPSGTWAATIGHVYDREGLIFSASLLPVPNNQSSFLYNYQCKVLS